MKTIWDPADRNDLMQRFNRLEPESAPLWGRMNAAEMLAHVVEGMRFSLGESEAASRRSIFRFWPLKYLFVYFAPFPKGAPAPREFVTRGKPVQWDSDQAALWRVMEVLAARNRQGRWPDHPIFGPLSGRAWGALGWRHFDHHLRQFGL